MYLYMKTIIGYIGQLKGVNMIHTTNTYYNNRMGEILVTGLNDPERAADELNKLKEIQSKAVAGSLWAFAIGLLLVFIL